MAAAQGGVEVDGGVGPRQGLTGALGEAQQAGEDGVDVDGTDEEGAHGSPWCVGMTWAPGWWEGRPAPTSDQAGTSSAKAANAVVLSVWMLLDVTVRLARLTAFSWGLPRTGMEWSMYSTMAW